MRLIVYFPILWLVACADTKTNDNVGEEDVGPSDGLDAEEQEGSAETSEDSGAAPDAESDTEPDTGDESEPQASEVDTGEDTGEVLVLGGLPVLGSESNDITTLDFRVVGDAADGLNTPRDLAFNPDVPGELWVVNRTDDSVTVFSNAGMDDQSSQHIIDPYAVHFMDEVSSIAFGAALHEPTTALNFATCQESTNTYDGLREENFFMGPTLWSSDLDIFGQSNPEAVEYLSELYGSYTDLGSHLDMLHESPLCTGIAHESDNVYWVFDGYNQSIYRYDFQADHGAGFSDHGDGIMARYVEGQVAYSPGVPSHMVFDGRSGLLYIADTGNNRIAVLDTVSGVRGSDLESAERETTHYEMTGALLSSFVDGTAFGLEAPSGLALVEDTLFVTDNATSEIVAFDMHGAEIDRVNTGIERGALMGIAAPSLDDLWLVSATENRVYRLQPHTR